MLNYEIDPEILAEYIPAGTVLDQWQGRTFVSIVGFQFLGTRLFGVRVPFYANFEEVNLRLYVRRETTTETRRGVVFIKEIVPHRISAWTARKLYNERYIALPMRHQDRIEFSGHIKYEWKTSSRWNRLGIRVSGSSKVPAPDSEESFIAEHYWGYVMQQDGSTLEYHVEHPPWQVYRTSDTVFDCDVASIYGKKFVPFLATQPSSAFLAVGSRVIVRRGVKIGA